MEWRIAQHPRHHMEDAEDTDIKVAAIAVAMEREAVAVDIAHKTVRRSEHNLWHNEAQHNIKSKSKSPTP